MGNGRGLPRPGEVRGENRPRLEVAAAVALRLPGAALRREGSVGRAAAVLRVEEEVNGEGVDEEEDEEGFGGHYVHGPSPLSLSETLLRPFFFSLVLPFC